MKSILVVAASLVSASLVGCPSTCFYSQPTTCSIPPPQTIEVTKPRLNPGDTTQLKVRVSLSEWRGGCNGGDTRAEKVFFYADQLQIAEVQVPQGVCFEYRDISLDWMPMLTADERKTMTEKRFSVFARVIPSRRDDPVLPQVVTVVVPN